MGKEDMLVTRRGYMTEFAYFKHLNVKPAFPRPSSVASFAAVRLEEQ